MVTNATQWTKQLQSSNCFFHTAGLTVIDRHRLQRSIGAAGYADSDPNSHSYTDGNRYFYADTNTHKYPDDYTNTIHNTDANHHTNAVYHADADL